MENVADLDGGISHAVNHDVGQGREHQFPLAPHPDAEASEVRKLLQSFASIENGWATRRAASGLSRSMLE
jgi:hypothetical protein